MSHSHVSLSPTDYDRLAAMLQGTGWNQIQHLDLGTSGVLEGPDGDCVHWQLALDDLDGSDDRWLLLESFGKNDSEGLVVALEDADFQMLSEYRDEDDYHEQIETLWPSDEDYHETMAAISD